jgi:PAS domain S-box-containing protein
MTDISKLKRLRNRQWTVLALVLAVGIFVADVLTPAEIELASLYVVVLLVADNARPRRRIWVWAGFCVALSLITYALLFQTTAAVANAERLGVAIATIVCTAYVLARRSVAVGTVEQQARALDVSASAILVRDRCGRIVLWNAAAERLYGWTSEQAVGADASELLCGQTRAARHMAEATLMSEGRWAGEAQHRLRSGDEIKVLCNWTLAGEGADAFVVEANVDAQAQRAADATRLSEQRYRKIFDTLAIAVWEHDMRPMKAATEDLRAAGVVNVRRYIAEHPEFVKAVRRLVPVTDVNATALRLMGVASREEFFEHLAEFLPEDDASFADCIVAVDENRSTFVSETRVRVASGELIPILVAIRFPPGEGLERITASIFDLREQMKLQATVERTRTELEHALRVASLGELSGSIAHEVNQPLSAVTSSAYASLRWLNAETPNLAGAKASIEDVLKGAEQASAVVKRVRKLMGKAAPDRLPVSVDPLVADTVRLLRAQAQAHGVVLETRLQAHAVQVLGDRILLQQVLVNLVNNAVQSLEAADTDDRRVLLSTRCANGRVVVEVEDSGPGFSQEACAHAFQSFFTTKARGMGLGLSISRATVEAHDGVLSIGQSRRLGGARLTIALPTGAGPQARSPSTASRQEISSGGVMGFSRTQIAPASAAILESRSG